MKQASLAFGVLLSSAVLIDCGSKMLGPDDLESQASAAVTAAGSIVTSQVAVSGVTNDWTFGESPADFRVTDSGQASYTVPLWTPPGPMGMAPSLAIQYDSSGGSGPLGVGFSLTGNVISKIERCQKTVAIDNEAGPLDFSGTTYCLDGKRLMPRFSGSNEYRTREDDGSKIVRSGTLESSPTGWTVWARNGQVLTYGAKTDGTTRLTGTLKPTSCVDNTCAEQTFGQTSNGTLAWMLEKVVDRVARIAGAVSNEGNYISIYYDKSFSSGTTSLPKYGSDFDFKEMLISRIEYGYGPTGSTARRKVLFTYGTDRSDARYTFVSGLPIQSTKLLTKIEMHGPNPSATLLLKSYNFHYELGTVSSRARLKRIFECDGASRQVCKFPNEFTWEEGTNNFLEIVDPTVRSMDYTSGISVLDYNADGKSDIVVRTPVNHPQAVAWYNFYTSEMTANTAQGATTNVPVTLEPTRFQSEVEYQILSLSPFDIDGDSRSDISIVASPNVPSKRFDLYRNTGNQFASVAEPVPPGLPFEDNLQLVMNPLFLDLDGDGLPEEIRVGKNQAIDNTVTPAKAYAQLLYQRNVAGTLGERLALTETAAAFRSFTTLAFPARQDVGNGYYIPFEGHTEYGVDVDGSGRTGLLIRDSFFNPAQNPPLHSASNMMRKVHLSRGGAVLSSLLALQAARRGNIGFHYLWLDVNGDGLPDAINVPNSTTSATTTAKATEETASTGIARIRINTGAGFKGFTGSLAAGQGTKYAINSREDAGVQVADFNQDGEADIVLLGQAVRADGVTDRSTVQVLVGSTGNWESNHAVPALFPFKMTNGQEIPAALPLNPGAAREGPMPAALGDFNGDGLVDIVIARSTGTVGSVMFHFYIRQGTKADLLKTVVSATGRTLGIQYAPVSEGSVYARMRTGQGTPGGGATGPWEQPPECRHPHVCLTNSLWVVSRYEVTNDQKVNVGHNMSYAEGRHWRNSWLGFAERWDTDQTTGLIDVTTYDNRTAGVAERYPFAFRPAKNIRVVRDNGLQPPVDKPHRFVTTYIYNEVANIFASSAYSVRLANMTEVEEILNGTPLHMPLSQFVFNDNYSTVDRVANSTTAFTYDQFDNLLTQKRTNTMSEILEKVYTPVSDTNEWLMNRVSSLTESSTTSGGTKVSRSRSYTYYPGTLLLDTETIEGSGSADVRSVIRHTRGAGACGQVTQKTITATRTADDMSDPASLTRTETTTYDTLDRVTVASTTNALNQPTLHAYHPGLGVLAQSEDPNGVKTTYQYDTYGRIRKRTVTHPSAPSGTNVEGEFTVSYETPPAFPSQISSIVAALGPSYAEHLKQVGGEETIVTYNLNGRELVRQTRAGNTQQSDGQYRYVLTRYTPVLGQVATVSTPFRAADTTLRLTTLTHDTLGRLIKKVHPGTPLAQMTYFYTPLFGPLGWTRTITDERGKVREESTNEDGQIAGLREFVGTTNAMTTYNYAPFGLLKQVFPPLVVSPGGTKSALTTYNYDVLGRRTQVIEPNAGTTTISYNAFGEVVKEVDALGTPTFIKRDALGRVRERSNTRDGVNSYVWDNAPRGTAGAVAIGKVASTRSFDNTTTTHTYDTYGRPDLITWGVQGRNYAFKHNYAAATGKLSQLDYPTTGTTGSTRLSVTYGYDSSGRISSVTRAGATTPYWRATRWWADGKVDRESDGTGMVTTRVFDNNRRWLNSIRTAAGTTTIQNVVYLHDAVGNVFDRRDADSAVNTSEGFEYDDVNQLKKWDFISSAGSWSTNYQPHSSGVIQQIKTGPDAASLNYDYHGGDASDGMPHAARAVSGITRFHDFKGRFQSTFPGNSFDYTTFDLPKTIFDGNGNPLVSYQYDAANRRAMRQSSGPQTTTASIAGLYERSDSGVGNVKHKMYIRGPGNRVVAEETWTEVGSGVQASPVLYHHDDIVGSTVVTNTTNTTTTGLTRLRYDPFGQRIMPTNPTQSPAVNSLPTRIGFTGHEMDDEANLINMNGRIYDPRIARFLTPDPIVPEPYRANGHDRYGYVLNNPLRFTDPSGFSPKCPGGTIDIGGQCHPLHPPVVVVAVCPAGASWCNGGGSRDPADDAGSKLDKMPQSDQGRPQGGNPNANNNGKDDKGVIFISGRGLSGGIGIGPLGFGGSISVGIYYGWQNGRPKIGVWGSVGGTAPAQAGGVAGVGGGVADIKGVVDSVSVLEGAGGDIGVDMTTSVERVGVTGGVLTSGGRAGGFYGGVTYGIGTPGAHAYETRGFRFGF
jgi:RHS repeat-associated protein